MDSSDKLGSQQVSGNSDVSDIGKVDKGEVSSNVPSVSVLPGKERQPEVIIPSEPELNIHPEIAQIGVEKTPEYPVLTDEHKEAGIRHSEEKPIIITEKAPFVSPAIPISENQARHIAKTGNVSDKKFWLANLVLKVLGRERRKEQNI